jgi:hypothetical protein
MEDSSFVGVEAAAAGFGGAAFCAFSGDLGFHLVLLAVLLADGIGRALSWMMGVVLLNRRKLGVTLRCFTFYCTKFIENYYIYLILFL